MPQKHEVPSPIHIQKFLGGLDYPAGKKALLEKAQQKGADEDVLRVLEQIPDQEYSSPVAVSRAVGKIH